MAFSYAGKTATTRGEWWRLPGGTSWEDLQAYSQVGIGSWLTTRVEAEDRVQLCFALFIGFADHILCIAPSIFKIALHLLSDSFDLELGIRQSTRPLYALRSYQFVNGAVHMILIHKSPFVGSILAGSTLAAKLRASEHFGPSPEHTMQKRPVHSLSVLAQTSLSIDPSNVGSTLCASVRGIKVTLRIGRKR
jgi:hypothetical protein